MSKPIEEFDRHEWRVCPTCLGDGGWIDRVGEPRVVCPDCGGDGKRIVRTDERDCSSR